MARCPNQVVQIRWVLTWPWLGPTLPASRSLGVASTNLSFEKGNPMKIPSTVASFRMEGPWICGIERSRWFSCTEPLGKRGHTTMFIGYLSLPNPPPQTRFQDLCRTGRGVSQGMMGYSAGSVWEPFDLLLLGAIGRPVIHKMNDREPYRFT